MNNYLKIGLIFVILSFLFIGVYEDDEFNEASIFLKYKPSLKMHFESPIGMQDLKISDLSTENQIEEKYYEDFIKNQHYKSEYLSLIPFILIQATLTFICFGTKQKKYKIWQSLIHFLINFLLTTIGIAFLLTFAKTFTTVIICLLIIMINYFTFLLIQKDWKIKKTFS